MNSRDQKFFETIRDKVFLKDIAPAAVPAREDGEATWIFDFRAVALDPAWLNTYAEIFWEKYATQYPFQVGGLETAAIPLITAIVMKSFERGTPVNGFYLRRSRKKTGLHKIIEGTLNDHPIIIVDDLVNNAHSINFQRTALKEEGKTISKVFTIVRYRALEAYDFLKPETTFSALYTLEDFGQPLLSTKSTDIPSFPYEILWRFQSRNPGYKYVNEKSAPVIDNSRVYVGSDSGVFWAINQSDGSVAWSYKVGFHPKRKGIFSSPVLDGGVVYFGAYDGNVYALDAETGERKWMNLDADWVGSSPAVATDLQLLFIGLEFGLWKKQGGIAAIDLHTGKTVWEDTTSEFTHGSPLYIPEEQIVVIGSNDHIVYCYEARSGKRLWTYTTLSEVKACFAYDAQRRRIVFGSHDSRVYALNVADGSLAWSFETDAVIFSTPLVVGDVVYVTSLDKRVYALDLATGNKIWSFFAWGRIFSTPVLARGSLWVGANDGRLYELDPATGELRSSAQLSERIVNAIAYNAQTDTIFLPTFANELYAIRKKDDTEIKS